jgi:hypothetical protein
MAALTLFRVFGRVEQHYRHIYQHPLLHKYLPAGTHQYKKGLNNIREAGMNPNHYNYDNNKFFQNHFFQSTQNIPDQPDRNLIHIHLPGPRSNGYL